MKVRFKQHERLKVWILAKDKIPSGCQVTSTTSHMPDNWLVHIFFLRFPTLARHHEVSRGNSLYLFQKVCSQTTTKIVFFITHCLTLSKGYCMQIQYICKIYSNGASRGFMMMSDLRQSLVSQPDLLYR